MNEHQFELGMFGMKCLIAFIFAVIFFNVASPTIEIEGLKYIDIDDTLYVSGDVDVEID